MQKFMKAMAAIMLMIAVLCAAGCKKTDDPNNGGNNSGGNNGGGNNGDNNGGGTAEGMYVGVIGFNEALYTKQISLLNSSSEGNFLNFIEGLTMRDATALYHAENTALNWLQEATLPADLINVSLVTFTDGLDNASLMLDNSYSSQAEFLNAINTRIMNDRVQGKSINAYAIGMKGNDVVDEEGFRQNLRKLSSSQSNVFEVEDMDEATERFGEIASQLYNESSTFGLSVKIPGGYDNNTVVRITFDNVSEANCSSQYIQATYSRESGKGKLSNISYNGLQSTSGTSVISDRQDGPSYWYTFMELWTLDNELVTDLTHTKLWRMVGSETEWQPESEFTPSNYSDIIVDRKSAVTVLVLDCTTSLGEQDFKKMKEAAKEFIRVLNDNSGTGGGNGGGGNGGGGNGGGGNGGNSNYTISITLSVGNASTGSATHGSKVDVNTATGTVNYESGDKIYVGSGGKYVGYLTHDGDYHFVGNITNPTEGQLLHFYFLGNVTPTETLGPGITEECSVIISDQTQHLPVISYGTSTTAFSSGTISYTTALFNKCALVKFNVNTSSETATCLNGMNNMVTVDFAENTISNSQKDKGLIKLPAGSGEKWAILLPQDAMEAGNTGSAFSDDGRYEGTRGAIPTIKNNDYLTDGILVEVNSEVEIPQGALRGQFTINENGDGVYFSQGNLQYKALTNTWQFATNQYDYIGSNNRNIASSYNGWIDLFGWGTSGYNGKYPYMTSTLDTDYGNGNNNIAGTNYDWGVYNKISNGGNTTNTWRTLTREEWVYVFNMRSTTSGIRYAKTQVNNVNGVILLPDNWNSSYYTLNSTNQPSVGFSSNVISATTWTNALESHGAVFLPAAGYRTLTSVYMLGGYYWSASYYNGLSAYEVHFDDSNLNASDVRHRPLGYSVRLVLDF